MVNQSATVSALAVNVLAYALARCRGVKSRTLPPGARLIGRVTVLTPAAALALLGKCRWRPSPPGVKTEK